MPQFTVKYQAGSYSGTRSVNAEDEEHAIAQVKAWVHRTMSLSMYSESYRIVSSNEETDE